MPVLNEGTYLVLNTRVLSLSVLTNENRVHVIVRSLEPLDGHTWTDICEEVECPAESQVEGDVALANYAVIQQLVPWLRVTGTYSAWPADLHEVVRYILFRDCGSCNLPFKATVFFLTELIAASGITVFPPLRIGVTLTSSHSIGT